MKTNQLIIDTVAPSRWMIPLKYLNDKSSVQVLTLPCILPSRGSAVSQISWFHSTPNNWSLSFFFFPDGSRLTLGIKYSAQLCAGGVSTALNPRQKWPERWFWALLGIQTWGAPQSPSELGSAESASVQGTDQALCKPARLSLWTAEFPSKPSICGAPSLGDAVHSRSGLFYHPVLKHKTTASSAVGYAPFPKIAECSDWWFYDFSDLLCFSRRRTRKTASSMMTTWWHPYLTWSWLEQRPLPPHSSGPSCSWWNTQRFKVSSFYILHPWQGWNGEGRGLVSDPQQLFCLKSWILALLCDELLM